MRAVGGVGGRWWSGGGVSGSWWARRIASFGGWLPGRAGREDARSEAAEVAPKASEERINIGAVGECPGRRHQIPVLVVGLRHLRQRVVPGAPCARLLRRDQFPAAGRGRVLEPALELRGSVFGNLNPHVVPRQGSSLRDATSHRSERVRSVIPHGEREARARSLAELCRAVPTLEGRCRSGVGGGWRRRR
jgi:hypothetical protein